MAEENRFESEMTRMMNLVIRKLDGLETDFSTLKGDVSTLKGDVSTLKGDVSEIKEVQKEHSEILKRLDAKTDTIAEKVLEHEVRITKAEQNIEDLRGGIH